MIEPTAGLEYNDEERSLRASVRSLLAKRCPPRQITGLYDGDLATEAAAWQAMCELGLVDILIPETFGGAGGAPTDAGIVLEELGYAAAPGPFLASSVVAATILTTVGDQESLKRIAAGEVGILLIPVDRSKLLPSDLLQLDRGAISGTIPLVSGAAQANFFLAPVRSENGIALHVIESDSERVEVTRIPALDMTRALADVRVSEAHGRSVSTDCGAEVDRALMIGAALATSDQLGLAQWCLDTLVDYMGSRYQFSRPIGSFQALKHRMADLWVELELMRSAARNAARAVMLDSEEAILATALAQSFSSDAVVHVAEETVQLHAGIAMTWEHPAHLYLKRAKASQISFGIAATHRDILAEATGLASLQ